MLSKLIGRSGLQMLLSQHGLKNDDGNLQSMLELVKADELLELADPEEISRYFLARGLERQTV